MAHAISCTLPLQTYYAVKDILYLSHEPLLERFRGTKALLKRVTRALHRKEVSEAKRMYDKNKPVYSLDHILKERYPRFSDAIAELDDALSMAHLYASLPSLYSIRAEKTAMAKQLVREWQYYIARTRTLRKVFFSIKGVYFQADVKGMPVTWLQPWQFAQSLPSDVDYRVMSTFMDLYESVLKFVMFKLYYNIGLAYPPRIRTALEESGGHLAVLEFGATAAKAAADGTAAAPAASADAGGSQKATERLATLQSKLAEIIADGGAVSHAGGAATKKAKDAQSTAAAMRGVYDFVDEEDAAADEAELKLMQEFGETEVSKFCVCTSLTTLECALHIRGECLVAGR